MKRFWFGGQCSADFGLMATGSGTFNAPERDMELIGIPGRNGDLIQDNGRYKNINVSYPVSICSDFTISADTVRAWLLSKPGYKRLEDEYNPDYFRLGVCKGPIQFSTEFLCRSGEATITFNCKPQRFLKSGEIPLGLNVSDKMIRNPTLFPAQPLLTLIGNGDASLTIGGCTISVSDLAGSVVVDCESMEIYREGEDGSRINASGSVEVAPDFPVLEPGENEISMSGLLGVRVVPRWWTL